jgi:hypothetical protein
MKHRSAALPSGEAIRLAQARVENERRPAFLFLGLAIEFNAN